MRLSGVIDQELGEKGDRTDKTFLVARCCGHPLRRDFTKEEGHKETLVIQSPSDLEPLPFNSKLYMLLTITRDQHNTDNCWVIFI